MYVYKVPVQRTKVLLFVYRVFFRRSDNLHTHNLHFNSSTTNR